MNEIGERDNWVCGICQDAGRAGLVDAVMDLPGVQPGSRLEAAVRLGACGHAARRPDIRLVIAAW